MCRHWIFAYFLVSAAGVCDRCAKQLRVHAKHTHKPIGVDWWCPRDVSRDQSPEIAIFAKMHWNPGSEAAVPIPVQNPPKPKFKNVSQQETSVSVGETSCATTNDYQFIRNHARSNSGANGGVGGSCEVLHFRPSIFEISEISRKCSRARTYENQGTPSPSLAQDCKCAFGAKNAKNDEKTQDFIETFWRAKRARKIP